MMGHNNILIVIQPCQILSSTGREVLLVFLFSLGIACCADVLMLTNNCTVDELIHDQYAEFMPGIRSREMGIDGPSSIARPERSASVASLTRNVIQRTGRDDSSGQLH